MSDHMTHELARDVPLVDPVYGRTVLPRGTLCRILYHTEREDGFNPQVELADGAGPLNMHPSDVIVRGHVPPVQEP